MRILTGIVVVLLAAASAASAGEVLLANGSRLEGELATDLILVSTGTTLVEVMPDQVESLVPGEIRLADGRVVRGTIIGGVLKVRTPLGEMGLTVEELQRYTARREPVPAQPAPAPVAGVTRPAGYEPPAPPPAEASAPGQAPAPPAAAPSAHPAPPPGEGRVAALPPGNGKTTGAAGQRFRVVVPEAPVHRNAVTRSEVLGKVRRGDEVAYLDAIDRRLWLPWFDTVLDWGHWIKVRTPTGLVGWVEADALEATR